MTLTLWTMVSLIIATSNPSLQGSDGTPAYTDTVRYTSLHFTQAYRVMTVDPKASYPDFGVYKASRWGRVSSLQGSKGWALTVSR